MNHFEALLPANWKSQLDEWLHEDIPSFDYGGFVVGMLNEIICFTSTGQETSKSEQRLSASRMECFVVHILPLTSLPRLVARFNGKRTV